jgi:hypothetical protein
MPNDGERLPMSHYKATVRDVEFNLFEVLDLEKAARRSSTGDVAVEARCVQVGSVGDVPDEIVAR